MNLYTLTAEDPEKTNYYINSDWIGFLSKDNADVKKRLREIWYFTLGWSFSVNYPSYVEVSDSCYTWSFLQRYNFVDRGTLKVSFEMVRSVCEGGVNITHDEYSLIWISVFAGILSTISFVLFLKYFSGMAKHMKKMQTMYEKRVQEF